MRFYTESEIESFCEYFNNEIYTRNSLNETFKLFSSRLSKFDFKNIEKIKFSEFKKKYELFFVSGTGMHDTYYTAKNLLNNDIRLNELFLEYNSNNFNDLRFPLIILCSYKENESLAPEIIFFAEYEYLIKNYNNNNLEVCVINKIVKPMDKTLLDEAVKKFNLKKYDDSLFF